MPATTSTPRLVSVEFLGDHVIRGTLSDGRVRDVVRVHDAWRVGNRWWRGEAPSRHYLLELEDGLTLEVYEQAGAWRLERVLD